MLLIFLIIFNLQYFYSIKDVSIGGRCRCNGHADLCDITDPTDSYKLICRCQHNTCGHNCERCCPGFEQKAWSQSKYDKLFECERKTLICNTYLYNNSLYSYILLHIVYIL